MEDEIKPGEKVISLISAARSAALVGGAVAGAISGWITNHKVTISVMTFIAGAIIGLLIGTIIGRFIFPAEKGHVMIVKRGPSSLPLTLKGNIITSFASALVVCSLMVLIMGANIKDIAVMSIGIPVIIGAILAILASLI